MSNKLEQIHKDVELLENDHVLSIYLNTNPRSDDWKIRLKNGLRKMEEYIAASNPEQVKEFSKIYKRVAKTIQDHQKSFTNSLICFASKNHIHLSHLQIPLENDFQWKVGPAMEQLDKLFEQYSNRGVILLSRDKVILLTTSLGELIHEEDYELDIEKGDWKQYRRMSYGNMFSSNIDAIDRRIKEKQMRWYRSIIPTIERYAKKHKWQGAHLVGPSELTKIMKQQLKIKITGETTRNYSGKSAHVILEKTLLAQ